MLGAHILCILIRGSLWAYFCFEIRCLHPQNCVFVQISCASWRKNLVTQVKPGGKKWLLGGKKWLLGGNKWLLVKKMVTCWKKMVTRRKNHVTFIHFTRLAQENWTKTHILKNMKRFQKNEYAHCVYGIKIHHICSFRLSWPDPFMINKIKSCT